MSELTDEDKHLMKRLIKFTQNDLDTQRTTLLSTIRERVEGIFAEDIITEIYGIHDSSEKSCAGCDALPALDLFHSRVLSLLTEIEGEMK